MYRFMLMKFMFMCMFRCAQAARGAVGCEIHVCVCLGAQAERGAAAGCRAR